MLVAILGRQPKLSLAELEAKFSSEAIRPLGEGAALIDADSLDFERFGGLIRSAKLLTRLENHDFRKSIDYIARTLPDHLGYFEGRKIPFGLSVYGFDLSVKAIGRSTFAIKKSLKNSEKTLRIIENKAPDLNAAQILRNQVIKKGLELLLIRDGDDVVLAQTIAIQDVDAYSRRDYDRPCRDPRVGMLPPKLAQIMLNLANPPVGGLIMDLFCGTGVILQEALLMDYPVIGTDISQKMVKCSETNLNWLEKTRGLTSKFAIRAANARVLKIEEDISAIASEVYLGTPLLKEPTEATVRDLRAEAEGLITETLKNLAPQLRAGAPLCLAVPTWRRGRNFIRLHLENLGDLGYTRASFVHVHNEELIYHREGQYVGRELLVLKRQ